MFKLMIVFFLIHPSVAFSEVREIITCHGEAGVFTVSDRGYPPGISHLEIYDLLGHVIYDGQANRSYQSTRDTTAWYWVSVDKKHRFSMVTMYDNDIEETNPTNLSCHWLE